MSNKISLVTENWIFPGGFGSFGLLSGGLRIHFARRGTALNLALVRPVGAGTGGIGFLVIPFVGATIGIK